ncbi:MAG: response regulator [bacterium]
MKKILVVDDSPDWRNTHIFALKYHFGKNVEIHSANSAKQGHLIITKNMFAPYDIILVDMEMEEDFTPLYAGEWLIKQIQSLSEYSNSKIFIVSSVGEIAEMAAKYGVNYIPKDKCEDIMEYKFNE